MRILIFALALALASCGSDETTDTEAVTEESGSADFTAANDITAIDAATGEAANMAADVNYLLDENALNEVANDTASDENASR